MARRWFEVSVYTNKRQGRYEVEPPACLAETGMLFEELLRDMRQWYTSVYVIEEESKEYQAFVSQLCNPYYADYVVCEVTWGMGPNMGKGYALMVELDE